MALRVVSLEDKAEAVSRAIDVVRKFDRPPGSVWQRCYEALKAVGADLRGR